MELDQNSDANNNKYLALDEALGRDLFDNRFSVF
jgi:hypothetical protein